MSAQNRKLVGFWGIRLHQFLSFSSFFQKVHSEGGEWAFFPGCSMIGYDPELVELTYSWLLRLNPQMGIVSSCCAYPTSGLNDMQKFNVYQTQLGNKLKSAGIRKLVVCCPNCTKSLENLEDVDVISIWQFLDEHPCIFKTDEGITYVLHDPCPTRNYPEIQATFRRVMERGGVTWQEYNSNRRWAICCGKIKMLMMIYPEKGKELLMKRLSESQNRNILTYCFSCVDSFRKAGCNSVHGLDLIFRRPDEIRSGAICDVINIWKNRWKLSRKLSGKDIHKH
jgi:Fe-S oxidoreductase